MDMAVGSLVQLAGALTMILRLHPGTYMLTAEVLLPMFVPLSAGFRLKNIHSNFSHSDPKTGPQPNTF